MIYPVTFQSYDVVFSKKMYVAKSSLTCSKNEWYFIEMKDVHCQPWRWKGTKSSKQNSSRRWTTCINVTVTATVIPRDLFCCFAPIAKHEDKWNNGTNHPMLRYISSIHSPSTPRDKSWINHSYRESNDSISWLPHVNIKCEHVVIMRLRKWKKRKLNWAKRGMDQAFNHCHQSRQTTIQIIDDSNARA